MGFQILLVFLAADTSQWSGVGELKKGDRVGVVQSDPSTIHVVPFLGAAFDEFGNIAG